MGRYSLRRLLWAGPIATIAALLANLVYFHATRNLAGQYSLPLGGANSQPVPMPARLPVIAILVAGLLATLLFAFLIRLARQPATIFLSVSMAALILSLGGPINLPGGALQAKILLGGMHLLAAAILTGGILLLSRKK